MSRLRPARSLLGPVLAGLLLGGLVAPGATAAGMPVPADSPWLAGLVESGALPPVARRLPENPRVVEAASPGLHGGTLRLVFGQPQDTRILVVYGYARLVTYDRDYRLKPDILESVEVDRGRVFTMHLRKGHRWSDGVPFTAEDFRFWWEDVANNRELAPLGPPQEMVVDGVPAKFEILDPQTVRFSWPTPNPSFLPAVAGATPLYVYRPSHYL